MIDGDWSIEAVDYSMTEVLLLIGVEDNLCSFFIGKSGASWYKFLIDFNSPSLLLFFIPYENSHFFYLIESFSDIMLVNLLSFAFIKQTFDSLLLDLCHVEPT